jgi:hypothetical protein
MNDNQNRPEPAQAEEDRDMYCVSLGFYGDDLDPHEVSRLLGSAPTDSARLGDLIQRRTRSFAAPQGRWHLSTTKSTDVIETQLIAMLGRLTDDLSVWQSLTTRFDADLFCGVFLAHQGHGFDMSPRLHRLLADRNLHIVFDIYGPDRPSENNAGPQSG